MSETPRLLRALAGETLERPPIWFMRQAGRSLPEYHELRSRASDFIRQADGFVDRSIFAKKSVDERTRSNGASPGEMIA